MRRPTLEQHARELLKQPHEWVMHEWMRCGGHAPDWTATRVVGSVVTDFITRGPRKGKPNYRKLDRSLFLTTTVMDDDHKSWLADWETETGKCHTCEGTGKEWALWSADAGSKYRTCTRCEGDGLKREAKP